MEYTKEEQERMKAYEERTGEETIMPYETRLEIYRTKDTEVLESASIGINRALIARNNLDNEFDDIDDSWKTKTLMENLDAISEVLNERRTK